MRILFVTNFYPPHAIGGQGQSCQQVVEGLQLRGHQTLVLTSRHGLAREPAPGAPMPDEATADEPPDPEGVARTLYLEMELAPWRHAVTFFTDRKRREQHNLDSFRRCLQSFDPHVIFVWGMWNLPRSLPASIEQQAGERTLYRFADYWPLLPSQHQLYWQQPGRRWFSRLPKKIIGSLALGLLTRERRDYWFQFKNAYCVSSATRQTLVQSGAVLDHARVIHTGLDPQRFLSANGNGPHRAKPAGIHILYAGRLEATKGIDTIVSAMARLQARGTSPPARLSIAGSGSPQYETYLRELVFRQELNHCVRFLGQVPQHEMADLLHDTDIVVVPSRWPEPFARVVLEGMAAHTVVMATDVGGSAEIIEDGHNGLLFSPDDSDELARKIETLIADPQMRAELARHGHQTVMENFTFTRMLDEIEAYLEEIAQP